MPRCQQQFTAPVIFPLAVALFLQERVGFNDIPRLVESALSRVEVKYAPDLPDILEADRQARAAVLQTVGDMV